MLDYKSPTSMDMPPIETFLIEEPDPMGPFGAKEVGQGPLLPVIPAVTNAVLDAVGAMVDEVPLTPEKLVAALEGRYRRPVMPDFQYPETVIVPPLETAAPAARPEVDPAIRP
jgi:hypothetical protein